MKIKTVAPDIIHVQSVPRRVYVSRNIYQVYPITIKGVVATELCAFMWAVELDIVDDDGNSYTVVLGTRTNGTTSCETYRVSFSLAVGAVQDKCLNAVLRVPEEYEVFCGLVEQRIDSFLSTVDMSKG